ncbi:Toprim domain-containing protein [Nocardia amikacinitolerans]|uniref:toprim domain-containing protein n=1 Tax=Nocardia amikacinitolerans TaxID=756689 RepID=UPI0020A2D4CD|nr:toprim domain-containing protein [Nocardia amikacinitolerans]MCP2293636.1 Toprim domain-containing protein [Nocardia amikacinitolerans]
MDPHPHHPSGRSWETIITALERGGYGPGKGNGVPESWQRYLCPVHEGDGRPHTPSLGVRYDPKQAKTIVRCFSRCDDEQVLTRIGLRVRDMFDRLPERTNQGFARQHSAGGRPAGRVPGQVASPVERAILGARFPIPARRELGAQTGRPQTVDSYIYRWPNGRIEGAVHRVHTPHENGHAKAFWQARWTGTEWEKGGFAPLPWRLADIRQALDTGREIYVVEGEKDVQRANRAGLIATCNAMGAGKWTPDHAKWLRGAARVIVVADRDQPGYRHADKVAASLADRVGEVRVVQARGGKDLADHFDAGYDLADLEPVPFLDRHYRQLSPHQQREGAFRPSHDRARTR